MPRIPRVGEYVHGEGVDPLALQDEIDALRAGTFVVYESDWTLIPNGGSKSFTHDLDDIPVAVDVIRSVVADGKLPIESTADVTIAKTDTTITITNNVGDDVYFKVRAF